MRFEKVFDRVIGHEGSFTRDPNDRGNWTSGKVNNGILKGTKYGISAMTYPDLDIANLTLEKAKEIYLRDWWERFELDRFGNALAYQMFDCAINNGIGRAYEMLQRALGVEADGIIGEKTIRALKHSREDDLVLLFIAERIAYFARAKTRVLYGDGWMNRMAQNLRYAVEDL